MHVAFDTVFSKESERGIRGINPTNEHNNYLKRSFGSCFGIVLSLERG